MKMTFICPRISVFAPLLVVTTLLTIPCPVLAQPDSNWIEHDRNRPQPVAVTPAIASTQEQVGKAPSDAVVLFDGKDVSQWVGLDGSPTKWISRDGYMECVKGSGYVRTLQCFGDCQLHVEWAAPTPAQGDGQGRGNSGVFLGLDRYEIQVLDSYNSKTYADGGAASVYGQYPPLVNASLPPGQWQNYDIIYSAPHFDSGKLTSPARLTVIHNGVVVQNNVELTGPTSWLDRGAYQPHPEKQPISLQDHGNPVRFRNLWVRELKPGKKEFLFPRSMLEKFVGKYDQVTLSLEHDQLVAGLGGMTLPLFAEGPSKFFAKTVDLQIEFPSGADAKPDQLIWSVGEGANKAMRNP